MKNKLKALWAAHKHEAKELCALFVMFFLAILFVEFLYRRNVKGIVLWFGNHFGLVMMNVIFVMAVFGFFLLISKSARLSFNVTLIGTFILAFINGEKYALRNVPFVLNDLKLAKEVAGLTDQLLNVHTIVLDSFKIAGIVLFILLLNWLYKKQKISLNRSHGLTIILISIVVLGGGQWIYTNDIPVERTGFVYYLTNPTRLSSTEKIKIILESKVTKMMDDDLAAYVPPQDTIESQTGVKPNVIVIMSEAFFDINKTGLEMNQNPLPFFESLRQESTYGELYVPVQGGGTVNTEFEVMTGMTVKNYSDDWKMIYTDEIHQPMASLGSIFRKNGYMSIGLHPFNGWYYNRNEVYKYLGFNGFKPIEGMGETPKYGSFTTDAFLFDQIIDLIETTDQPVFNFSVTVQNHGPYADVRFTEDQKTVWTTTPLSDEAQYVVNNYAQGLYYSDKSLKKLINTLKASDEPTIVVFFGDHTPMLGENFLAYRESGYVGSEEPYELYADFRMMSVPYFIWNNIDDTSKETPLMNASYLTPMIVEAAGIPLPDYLIGVKALSEEMPLYLRGFCVDADGKVYERGQENYNINQLYYRLISDNYYLNSEVNAGWLYPENETFNAMFDFETETGTN